jgi:CHAD domain-containing protein
MKSALATPPDEPSPSNPATAKVAAAGIGVLRTDPPTAYELALSELRRLLGAWHRHEPGTRRGEDPEELHQLRVTVRRIDATLALFKHHLPELLVRTRATAKSLLRALGAARDYDVQLMELAAYCAAAPEADRAASEPLRERLEAEGARAHARLLRLLDAAPTQRWIEALTEASKAEAPGGADSALTVMPERVRRRFRKLRKTVRRLPASASMDEYHEVRRRAKQLRYAIESGTAIFGKPADDLLKALRRLQDQLGAHQDAHMASSRLAALAADRDNPLPPATLFLMGRLAERHSDLTAGVDKALSRSWRRVRGKRWKALRGRLGELSDRARAARRAPPAVARGEAPGAERVAAATASDAEAATAGAPAELASEPQPRLMKH